MQTQKYTAELHVAIHYGEERPQLSNKKKKIHAAEWEIFPSPYFYDDEQVCQVVMR